MEIYEALKNDHDEVKALMQQLVDLADNDNISRTHIVAAVKDLLIPHSRAEEAVFYNSLRLLDDTKTLAMHGYREHLEAETLLRTLQAEDLANVPWKATAYKLKEALENHIAEEEGEIFTAAKSLFTSEEAEAINEAFQTMKPEVQKEGMVGSTIDLVKNLMPPRLMDTISELPLPLVKNASTLKTPKESRHRNK